jgi:hypothetical protein
MWLRALRQRHRSPNPRASSRLPKPLSWPHPQPVGALVPPVDVPPVALALFVAAAEPAAVDAPVVAALAEPVLELTPVELPPLLPFPVPVVAPEVEVEAVVEAVVVVDVVVEVVPVPGSNP